MVNNEGMAEPLKACPELVEGVLPCAEGMAEPLKGSALRRTVLLAAVLICVIASCDIDPASGPVYWEDAVGTYEATYGVGADEQIVLLADSTYLHTYVSPGGRKHSQNGRWELWHEEGKATWAHVQFSDFINWYPMEYTCYSRRPTATIDTTPVGWGPYVQKQGDGSIRLKRCPSVGQYYSKVK